MYGTIARLQVIPGKGEALQREMETYKDVVMPGFVSSHIYHMDNNPNEYYLVVAFESRTAYVANANSPAQNERFQRMVQFLSAEPEWHDGEIVYPA